jgi:hypothetical protein
MTTHLVFIAWRWIVMDLPLTARLIVAGGGAYALLYLMLLTSFDRPAKALGPARWRRLHKTGLYWLGFVFATTVAARVMREPGNWLFITEALLFGAAVVLRLLAFARRQRTAATDSAR